jgi:hypothetical protein
MARTSSGQNNTNPITNFLIEKRLNSLYLRWEYEKQPDFSHFKIEVTYVSNNNIDTQSTQLSNFLLQTSESCIVTITSVNRQEIPGRSISSGVVTPLTTEITSLESSYIPFNDYLSFYFDGVLIKAKYKGKGIKLFSVLEGKNIYFSINKINSNSGEEETIVDIATAGTGNYYNFIYCPLGDSKLISGTGLPNTASYNIPVYVGNTLIYINAIPPNIRNMISVFYGDKSTSTASIATIPDPLTLSRLNVGVLNVTGTHNIEVPHPYNRSAPTETTVGGLLEGTTLENTEVQDVLDMMLYTKAQVVDFSISNNIILRYGVGKIQPSIYLKYNLTYNITNIAVEAQYYTEGVLATPSELDIHSDSVGTRNFVGSKSYEAPFDIYLLTDQNPLTYTKVNFSSPNNTQDTYSLTFNLTNSNSDTYSTTITWMHPTYLCSSVTDAGLADTTKQVLLTYSNFQQYTISIDEEHKYIYFYFNQVENPTKYLFFDKKTNLAFDIEYMNTVEYTIEYLTDFDTNLNDNYFSNPSTETVTYHIFRSKYKQPPGTYVIEVMEDNY